MTKKLTQEDSSGPPDHSDAEPLAGGPPTDSYDAELRHWVMRDYKQSTVVIGRVFGDRKGRWPDGYAIATSNVVSGAHEEGCVITTLNSRYLLSGPPGDLSAVQKLAERHEANARRRESVAHDERLFDLLQAAWGMDDQTFQKLAGLPPRWLWQWRNHYRAPSDGELARIRRLMGFHDAIRLVTYGEPNYPSWWRRRWREDSLIGARTPLEAALSDPAIMDLLEKYFRSQAGW